MVFPSQGEEIEVALQRHQDATDKSSGQFKWSKGKALYKMKNYLTYY